jgi:hypothetical protein
VDSQVVVVLGPESTGGRLVNRLVNGHHFSFPHGDHWPDDDIEALHPTHAVVCVRAWHPTIRSKTAHHTVTGAVEELQEAYIRIFGLLSWLDIPFMLVTYENLVARSDDVAAELAHFLERNHQPFDEVVTDQNAKWYEESVWAAR